MKRYTRMALAAGSAALLAGAIGPRAGASGSGDALAVRTWSGWETWWRRDAAPTQWSEGAPLAGRVRWRETRPGIEWGELQLRGASEAWRTRVVVVRLDPARVDLALDPAFTRDADWSVSDAAPDAAIALDAGQFRGSLPWGWVLTGGGEVLPPQYAPLAGAVVVDGDGRVRVVAPDSVEAVRAAGGLREAFQSYPMLLVAGTVPEPLRMPGLGVSLEHRDARLALGTTADGHVVIALTRFDALGQKLGRIPFGLTSPEMAAVMGALGCRQAVLLDGGISGQLLVRDREEVRTWPGIRRVPLGLVARVRP
jgi:phosphodiester glycosidase